jgi:hypothetical protein
MVLFQRNIPDSENVFLQVLSVLEKNVIHIAMQYSDTSI